MSVGIDEARAVRAGEELPLAALDAWLAQALPQLHGPLSVEQFPSGYSNLTYLLRKGEHELVLRRPPFGAQVKSGHDMAREYKVLLGLAPVYPPAPRPLGQCADASVIGAPFYVMERRRGLVLRRTLPASISPERFGAMCQALVDQLAALHAVDLDAAGLRDLGKPEGYVARQVAGWIDRWQRARTDDVPEIEALATWLREHQPPESGASLVHNDYKFDNVVLDPDDPTRVVAVLDWEMCTLGDPLLDLGTSLGYWVQPDDPPELLAVSFGPTAAPGGWGRRRVVERYAERSGRAVDGMLFYYAMGLLKIAVIVQQIYFRWRHGHTKDPRFAALDRSVVVLGRTAVRALERGEMP